MDNPKNQRGRTVGWLSWEAWLSLATAVRIGNVANALFILSLLVGVASTIAIVGTTNVKEWYWNKDRIGSAERIEKLRNQNLVLEKAVSPRILEQNLTGQKLKQFSDVSVLVISPPDFEPKRTAGQIRWMLRNIAGWKQLSGTAPSTFAFFDGVVVHVVAGLESARSREAGDALIAVLNEAGIEARFGPPIMELGPSALLVEVGPKPLPATMQLKPEDIPGNDRDPKIWGNILE